MSKPLKNSSHNTPNPLIILVLFTICVSILNSCVTVYDTINNRNFADTYNPAGHTFHPEYTIYMKSAIDVRLYFRFFPTELAFMTPDGDSVPQARARIFFRVTSSYSSTQIIDSLSRTFTLKGKPKSHFLGYIPISLPADGKYVFEVFLTDMNVNYSESQVIEYNHITTGNQNSFMYLSQHGNPLFYPYFSVADTFRVRTEMFESKQLWVSYYRPDTVLPAPPDIPKTAPIEPQPVDTSWVIANADTTLISFRKPGAYLFTSSNIGLAH